MTKTIETYFDFYNDKFSKLTYIDKKTKKKFIRALNLFLNLKKKKKKILIFGNGGSAAMASHFSVDMTKIGQIRTVNFNESDLITCFANDYGFEQWVEKAVEFYGDEDDVFIAISSSGNSMNMLNGCEAAKRKKFASVITLSGFDSDNPLRHLGDINFWVDSRAYNIVEMTHQIWLLTIIDMLIGASEY
mgnify:CR=1 FL=1